MGYISEETKIVHAQGAHKYVRRDEDILTEWWRVANVVKYTHMAIPKDEAREYCVKATELATMIANLDYVYKTGNNRYEIYKKIEAFRKKNKKADGTDYTIEESLILNSGKGYGTDCSALCMTCLYWAGFPFKTKWQTYTGGLETVLKKSGLFNIFKDRDHLNTDKYAKTGSMYWKVNPSGGQGHVVMSINDYPEQPEPKPEFDPPYLKILKGSFNIRSGASSRFKSIGVANEGDIFKITGEAENGWHIIDFDDEDGYITNAYDGTRIEVVEDCLQLSELPELPKNTEPFVKITSGSLWVRSKPTLLGKKLGVAKSGEEYDLIEVQNGWLKINYNGAEGYVSGSTSHTEVVNAE